MKTKLNKECIKEAAKEHRAFLQEEKKKDKEKAKERKKIRRSKFSISPVIR